MSRTFSERTDAGLPKYVSMDAVADAASISRETVRRLIAKGDLPAIRIGGQIRIRTSDVLVLFGSD